MPGISTRSSKSAPLTYVLDVVPNVVGSDAASRVASRTRPADVAVLQVVTGRPGEARGELGALVHRLAPVLATPISLRAPRTRPTRILCVGQLGAAHSSKARMKQVPARVYTAQETIYKYLVRTTP